MVKIGLSVKASLKNVDKFYPQQPDNFSWPLRVKCTACFEVDPNLHLISKDDTIELTGASANFAYKCKMCHRENHLTIIPAVSGKVKSNEKGNLEISYRSEDEDQFKAMIGFDCRGLELVGFEPGDGWAVQSGRKIFTDVDLSDREWFDYNDLDDIPVEITEIEHKFVTLK